MAARYTKHMGRRCFVTPRLQLMQLLFTAGLILVGVLVMYQGGGHVVVLRSGMHMAEYQFPGGGQRLLPDRQIVALYGEPDTPELGALGQQPLDASIIRVKDLARQYVGQSNPKVLPAFEIIATVASDTPMADGSYSRPADSRTLATWVAAARQHGVYVMLDLQPGRTDFFTQAQQLAPLLAQPNVGLALDPEWRLATDQLPLQQIGSVDVGEINKTAAWLADLTRRKHLPQKLLLLHQFRPSMIVNRAGLDTAYPELAYVIQMDGQGSQPDKENSWQAVTAEPPEGVQFGWKNFFEKDVPMRSPQETMTLVPRPAYVSYQ